jgi:formylglycine-generating enzyme required for sulfatase activity
MMRAKIILLIIGLTLLAGVHPVASQPALGIVATNNQFVLYWPLNVGGTNGVLQSATNLASPNWLSATDTFPVNYGSPIAVSVTNAPSARFFRLSLVPPAADGMALIPAGPFTIGDTLDGETDAIPATVYVSAFYMDTNLVSYSQWQGVYTYATNHGYNFLHAGSAQTNLQPLQPVELVDWYDCAKWSNARSKQEGLTPVYYTDTNFTQIFTTGDEFTTVYANWETNGYRLPTEAEWEKAARGGLSGQRFPWGETISETQANYLPNSGETYDMGGTQVYGTEASPATSPVGAFPPNGYGLYDMAGNVWEWCWDLYAEPAYPAGSPYLGGTDPRGPAVGSDRVRRGGSYFNYAPFERCAYRFDVLPTTASSSIGFRCVRGF